MNVDELTFDVSQEIEIKAAPGTVYKNMIAQLSQIMGGDEKPMNFVLEEWPGGRWFRDLGNGQGHLWGFVQVIKPPTLLEITGPLMMSYPVSGHVAVSIGSNRRRHAAHLASPRVRDDRSQPPRGREQGLGSNS